MEHTRIENTEIAIVILVLKTKNIIHIGVITPPPPIPAIAERATKIERIISPMISLGRKGRTGL